MYIHTRVGVHMHSCRRIFVYLYCPISLLHACISQVIVQRLHACVGGDWKWGVSMVSACCWRVRLCFGRGRDKDFVLHISLFLRVLMWWVGVYLYTHVHTHKLLGYLM